MQNAHLRLGRLEYRRSTGTTQTRVSVHVDHYMGEEEDAHLLSIFGHDAELGAVTAAIQENHRFEIVYPDGARKTVGLGKDASCYKGSLSVPGQKHPYRHLVAASTALHGNGSAGRTFVLNYQEHTREAAWATLVSLLGLPADPRWGRYVFDALEEEGKIKPLAGIGCDPAVIFATRNDLLETVGRACGSGTLPFPEKNGPVIWPQFKLTDILLAA